MTRWLALTLARNPNSNQVVVEVRGRALTELEYESLEDKSYVVSFDDKLLELKRAAGDDVLYLDLKEQGNMMRLINDSQVLVLVLVLVRVRVRVRDRAPNLHPRDSQEAPNLQLMYWPELDVSRGILPRRAFLVAKHAVPAYP